MANYKTSDELITLVAGLLTSVTIPKYDGSKPTKFVHPEYIVINALPLTMDVMQKGYVNVNYHCKDLADGVKDSARLQSMSQVIINLLKKVSSTTYLIDIEQQETFAEEQLGEHFSNLRFSVKYINN